HTKKAIHNSRDKSTQPEESEGEMSDDIQVEPDEADVTRLAIEQRNAAQVERDKAYRERAQLVAHLSANYPAEVVEAPGALADPWPVVYVDTPSGQMTWHITRADLDLFSHLRRVIDAAPGWDGHTTDEKYQRLTELTRTVATGTY